MTTIRPLFKLFVLVAILVILCVVLLLQFLSRTRARIRKQSNRRRKITLSQFEKGGLRPILFGFFHPYCNAGGGGERVLWAAINATQEEFANAFCIVYTGDLDVDKAAIVKRAEDAFGIRVDPRRLSIEHLKKRSLVSPDSWPRLTLIGQSLGSIALAFEALLVIAPDIYIDSMGYAFTYPLVSILLGIPVASYTHYPTISTDMLARVSSTNLVKLAYWRAFAVLYSFVGRYADLVMTNSTWTRNHIDSLWGSYAKGRISTVYPPCDTKALQILPIDQERKKDIVCVAQFRKEKNHEMLLRSFQVLLDQVNPGIRRCGTKLILIGTVRNAQDVERVEALKNIATQLGISENVVFSTNVPWPKVIEALGSAWIGVNAMQDEHFGIGVVEYMAAGLIPVVHDSAGPKLDIVTLLDGKQTGYHASSINSFATAFNAAFSLSQDECSAMRSRARQSAQRFSEEVFKTEWSQHMNILMRLEKKKRNERNSGRSSDVI